MKARAGVVTGISGVAILCIALLPPGHRKYSANYCTISTFLPVPLRLS